MASFIRRLVSGPKRRFTEAGFDLDLSYITERVIGMSWPGEGSEGLYRNPMSEAARFIKKYHPGSCQVYNLVLERANYPAELLDCPVRHFPMEDHQPPPLHLLDQVCQDAASWLLQQDTNVVIVHCKAGKGRTGTVISCLLLYLGKHHPHLFPDLQAASVPPVQFVLELFGSRRTLDNRGITIASQRRYVEYFYRTMMEGQPPAEHIMIKEIRVSNLPEAMQGDFELGIYQRHASEVVPQLHTMAYAPTTRMSALQGGHVGMHSLCFRPYSGRMKRGSSAKLPPDGSIVLSRCSSLAESMMTEASKPSMITELSRPSMVAELSRPSMVTEFSRPSMITELRRPSMATEPSRPSARTDISKQPSLRTELSLQSASLRTDLTEPSMPSMTTEASMKSCFGMRQHEVVANSLKGDIKLQVRRGKRALFSTWLHTSFLPQGRCHTLMWADLDKPAKQLPKDVEVQIIFDICTPGSSSPTSWPSSPFASPHKGPQHPQPHLIRTGSDPPGGDPPDVPATSPQQESCPATPLSEAAPKVPEAASAQHTVATPPKKPTSTRQSASPTNASPAKAVQSQVQDTSITAKLIKVHARLPSSTLAPLEHSSYSFTAVHPRNSQFSFSAPVSPAYAQCLQRFSTGPRGKPQALPGATPDKHAAAAAAPASVMSSMAAALTSFMSSMRTKPAVSSTA